MAGEKSQPTHDVSAEMNASILHKRRKGGSHALGYLNKTGSFISTVTQKPKDVLIKPHKPALTQAEQEGMYPPIDPSTIPEEERLDVLEVLKLGNTLSKAPTKPKGVIHSITAGYMCYQAAPYAFNYQGKLRAAYWLY